jgi:hypothetical protein
MNRVGTAVVVVIGVGVVVVAAGAGTGWFRERPRPQAPTALPSQQKELRNAAQAVELIARAAAEPPPKQVKPPPAWPPPAEPERPAPDLRWTARAADASDGVLCGGKVCAANQFCCGPPECGHCASRLTGPRCPSTCP